MQLVMQEGIKKKKRPEGISVRALTKCIDSKKRIFFSAYCNIGRAFTGCTGRLLSPPIRV